MGASKERLRVFVGSSTEGLDVANEIQRGLASDAAVTVWNQAFFPPSESALETLTAERIREFDFAVLVMTADDVVTTRSRTSPAPRDNLLLEAGLFFGTLGRERTILVHCADTPPALPSDLAGITCLRYPGSGVAELPSALGPVCTELHYRFRRLGEGAPEPRPDEQRPSRIVSGILRGLRDLDPPIPAGKVSRRRRRRSLGTAVVGASTSFPVANISVSGALLETDGELPLDEVLDLELRLDRGKTVTVKGRVVRIQKPDWQRMGGVGVRFEDLDRETERALHEYVHARDAVHCDEPDELSSDDDPSR